MLKAYGKLFLGFVNICNHEIIGSPIQNIIKLNKNFNVSVFWHMQISIISMLKHEVDLRYGFQITFQNNIQSRAKARALYYSPNLGF